MNKEQLEKFVEQFDDLPRWGGKKQTDYFAYFLTIERALNNFTTKQILECFDSLNLKPYVRTSVYLSEEGRKKNGRYIKCSKGYCLERSVYNNIKQEVGNEPKKVQVSEKLMALVSKIKNAQEKVFLQEAINCYRVESYRATIVMIWILAVDHLQKYVFEKKLVEFNNELAKNPDKKIKKIINYDDFSDLHEVKFIELNRAANIISNDIRKILDEKLGIRNSAAHSSVIIFNGHKTTEFVLDMIDNIILKY